MQLHTTDDYSWLGVLLGAAAVLGVLYLLKRLLHSTSGWRLAALLLLGLPMLWILFSFGMYRALESPPGVDWAYGPDQVHRSGTRPPSAVETRGNAPPREYQPLEELWNELHPVKIDLSEEAAKPQAEEGEQMAERPDWVDRPPRQIGEVYQRSVYAGPYADLADCYRHLGEKLSVVVANRIAKLAADDSLAVGNGAASLARLGIDMEYVLSELCTDKYVENVEGPDFEDRKKVYALVEFTEADDEQLLARWETFLRQQRVGEVGAVAASVLAGLALVYGLLKVNLAGVGRRTKRLFAGPAAAIIATSLLSLVK